MLEDLSGFKFGKLTVLKQAVRTNPSVALWLCECECGGINTVTSANLKHGRVSSCGCLAVKNLKGLKYGKLTVLYLDETTAKRSWVCECDCGTIKSIRSRYFKSTIETSVQSCGCLSRKNRSKKSPMWKGTGDMPSTYWTKVIYNAKRRGKTFNLTPEYAWQLFVKQGGCCVLSGWKISFGDAKRHSEAITASLDRIDSSIGYEVGNVQWLHKDINILKSNWTEKELISMAKAIADHH